MPMFYVGLSQNIKNPWNLGALSFSVTHLTTHSFLKALIIFGNDLPILGLLITILFKVSTAVSDAG